MFLMAQIFVLLLLPLFSFLFISGVYSSSSFTVINNCSYTVWPGIYSDTITQIPSTGLVLRKGESKSISAPRSWSGRIWGRTNCSVNSTGYFSCITGDCGSGKLECSTASTPHATLAEFALNYPKYSYYDISLLYGYNLPIDIAPQSNGCPEIQCSFYLNEECPSKLQKLSSGGDVVACMSACEAFKKDQYCCTGTYASPKNCTPTSYSDVFKKACPNAFSYVYDGLNSAFHCDVEADYVVTFCNSFTGSAASAAPSTPTPAPFSPPAGPTIDCPVNIETLNYNKLVSQCKQPYQVESCCGAFADLACPYAEQLNDLRNDCATRLFKYLYILQYPAGLFSSLCLNGTKNGIPCPENISITPASSPLPTTIPHSPPPAKSLSTGSAGKPKLPPAAAIVATVFVVIILSIILFIFLRRKAKKNNNLTMEPTGKADGNEISEAESLRYDLSYIKSATNNFSSDNKIGEGGFGEVFKGTLNSDQQVAVKRLSKSSGQGEQEFKNEVLVVAKLQHRNLVKLLGYCLENEEKILIYEYVPNESLDFILFDQEKKQSLNWSTRYKIIGGVARGILYLHEDSRLRIIHRDIKASNVLLDKDMNAKISDFGLARIVGFDEVQGSTNRVVGTFGYMSPEYIMHGQFSVKSDVFSFGVLVLEIISGKKNNKFYQSSEHLLSYAWKLWRDGKPMDLVDPALGDSFNKNEVTRCIHIGLLCIQENLDERPTMASVVHILISGSTPLQIPHQPAFFLEGRMMSMSNLPDPMTWSANGLSITEFGPR